MSNEITRIGPAVRTLDELPDLASKWEVASYLGVSWRTVDRLRKRGELDTVFVETLPRITKESVAAYVERQREASRTEEAEDA